jgi:hypothetical protein
VADSGHGVCLFVCLYINWVEVPKPSGRRKLECVVQRNPWRTGKPVASGLVGPLNRRQRHEELNFRNLFPFKLLASISQQLTRVWRTMFSGLVVQQAELAGEQKGDMCFSRNLNSNSCLVHYMIANANAMIAKGRFLQSTSNTYDSNLRYSSVPPREVP